jgi:hypothetical protein
MFEVSKIPHFSTKFDPSEIQNMLTADPKIWEDFKLTRSIFLINDEDVIVGFATEFDIMRPIK